MEERSLEITAVGAWSYVPGPPVFSITYQEHTTWQALCCPVYVVSMSLYGKLKLRQARAMPGNKDTVRQS